MSHENGRILFATSVCTKAYDSTSAGICELLSSLSVVNPPIHTTTCVIISREWSVQITGFCVGACN